MKTFVFVAAFALYASTSATTLLSYGDAAELVTASYTLGVAHPPGFPLYMLLGKSFATCLPWGDVAHRYSLLMGLMGAGCVTVVFATLRRLGCEVASALATALVLACSYDFWLASVTPEVTILNSLLGASLIGISAAAATAPQRAAALSYSAAGLFGLSMAHHPTVLFLLPVGLTAFAPVLRTGGRRWLAWVVLVIFCFALPYAYVPWAASQHPVVNYLDAPGMLGLWRFVTRQAYGSWQLAHGFDTWTFQNVLQVLTFYGRALVTNFTWLGIALASLGMKWLWQRHRRFALGLMAAFLLCGPLFLAVTRVPLESFTTQGVFAKFFGLSFVCLAVCLGMGAHALGPQAGRAMPQVRRWAAPILVGALAVYLCLVNYRRVDKHHFDLSYQYASDLFTSLPQGAIVIIHGDNSLFCGWYLQQVRKERLDLALHNASEVDIPRLLRDNVGRRPTFEIGMPGSTFAAHGLQGNPYTVMPWGLAMEVVLADTPWKDDADVWRHFAFQEDVNVHTYQDAFAQEIVYFYAAAHFNKAVMALSRHAPGHIARTELQRALHLYPDFAAAKQLQRRHEISLRD